MNIQIIRYRKMTETIDGHLYIDGQLICDCAENAITALKTGTYPLNVVKCKQHARKMPVLLLEAEVSNGSKVSGGSNLKPIETAEGMKLLEPKCSHCERLECVSNNSTMPQVCHMLKPGNGVYKRTDGSIILGTYLAPGCLTHPREAFADFYDRIRKSIERGHDLTLTIVEDYPEPKHIELSNFEMGQQILRQF